MATSTAHVVGMFASMVQSQGSADQKDAVRDLAREVRSLAGLRYGVVQC